MGTRIWYLAALIGIAACGGETEPVSDSGTMTATEDAATTTPTTDAGTPSVDAGSTTPDAGSAMPDADPTPPDAGSSAFDAGSSPADASAPAADSGASGNRTPAAHLARLGTPPDSPCRGYTIPSDVDLMGCTVQGPYQGQLTGTELGSAEPLSNALTTCIANPECSGFSAPFYLEADFTTTSASTLFEIDSSSFGCTFLVGCE